MWEVQVVSGVISHGRIGSLYVFLLSRINKGHFGTCFSFLIHP